jgi:hypothetical protein
VSPEMASPGSRAWIFQANPAKYAILDTLGSQQAELWNLRQHAHDVNPGDLVYIWVAGPQAGIYATGTVLTSPRVMSDSPIGIRHWADPRDGQQAIARVEVRYDRVLLQRPLLKPYLRADPTLRNLRILRSPRGTNFALTVEEALAIEEWLTDQPEQGST